MEVVGFPSPEMFKNEVVKLGKMVLTDTPTLCFYDSVRDLGFLDLSSSVGADISLYGTFRCFLGIRTKLQLGE